MPAATLAAALCLSSAVTALVIPTENLLVSNTQCTQERQYTQLRLSSPLDTEGEIKFVTPPPKQHYKSLLSIAESTMYHS